MKINSKHNKRLEKVDIKQEIGKQLMNLQKKSKIKMMRKRIIIDLKGNNLLKEDNFIQFQCQRLEKMKILKDIY